MSLSSQPEESENENGASAVGMVYLNFIIKIPVFVNVLHNTYIK